MVALYHRVFADSEGPAEGELIGDLAQRLLATTEGGDLMGFVAREEERIVGCILFTRLRFDDPVNAFLLSPVAVDTGRQRSGIGRRLIGHGLDYLSQSGVELVFTYGDPRYYAKTGFEPVPEAIAQAPFDLAYPEGWLVRCLSQTDCPPLSGRSRCVDAFNDPRYW